MIDELEAKRQKRRETHAGMVRWVKSLRESIPTETRAALEARSGVGDRDIHDSIKRVLDACTDEDIVDMLALGAGAHLFGELAEHIRAVRFVETETERVAREASPLATAYAKLNDFATAWLWGALSNVQYRAPRAGHPAVAPVMEELFALLRSGGRGVTKREWKRQIWQAMHVTLWSDVKGNGAHYLYFDDNAEPISDVERARMRQAANEALATMKRFAGK